MRTCIFAGTFDPITVGHENVIKKCLNRYGKVLVVVGSNAQKRTYFTAEERTELVKEVFKDCSGVTVLNYLELKDEYREYLEKSGARIYVRGIRNRKDKKFENEMKKKNKKLYPFIKTKYIKCSKKYRGISSTLVKEYLGAKKDYLDFIPESIREKIIKLIAKKSKQN